MENIEWFDLDPNEDGLRNIAYKDIGRLIPNIGELVGYNDVLKGDKVSYEDTTYTVVMVSRMGDFGLSKTGMLPYEIRVSPLAVQKQ